MARDFDWDWLTDDIFITIYKMPDGYWSFNCNQGVFDYFSTIEELLDKLREVVIDFVHEIDGGEP